MAPRHKHAFRPIGQLLECRRLLAAVDTPASVPETSAIISQSIVETQAAAGISSGLAASVAESSSVSVGGDWVSAHRMTNAEYNEQVERLQRARMRPYQVTGYEINGQPYFAAIWQAEGSVSWEARHGMTSSQYQDEFSTLVGQGYRLAYVNGYTIGGVDRYAAIWDKASGPEWIAHHRMSGTQFQTNADNYASQGYRITSISGYAIGSQHYFAAIWEKESGTPYVSRHQLTSEAFAQQSETFAAIGYDLIDVSGYTVGGVDYYTGVWEQADLTSVSRHAMSSSQYQTEFDLRESQGYQLIHVDGYNVAGIDRYVASWAKPSVAFTSLPTSGTGLPELSVVTDAVEQFMVEQQISAGSVAISKDGQIVSEIGIGWSDHERTQAIQPDALFRLASVVKPMTDAAVTKLVSQGVIGLGDQVFCTSGTSGCLLDITPLGTADPRVSQITVQHLLEHRGGWDRDISGDPLFNQIAIAGALGEASPPDQFGIARYVLAQPLDFSPGQRYAYSNFGYMVLGMIVEEVTGRDFTEYLQSEIYAPIGVASTEIELGRSLPSDRNSREPDYSHPSLGTSVFETSNQVAFPDGAFHLESMESLGGQIATAAAVTRFLDRYWISGEPRMTGSGDYTFYGSLPGTATMARQRTDGVNVVVLLNERTDASGNTIDFNELRQRVDSALNSVSVTVTHQDTIGLYQPDASLFHLKDSFSAGAADQYFAFGPGGNAGWTPLAGDWNGDGADTIGLYQPDVSLFHLKDSFGPGASDQYFAFGPGGSAGWIPLAGDWNGDGVDTIGLYQPDLSLFHLKDSFSPGASDQYFAFGPGGANWVPLVGDWDGDGIDTVGLYQPDSSQFHLKNSFTPGASDHYFAFGPGGNAGWVPVTGDWDGNGADTIGLYQPDASLYHLKNAFAAGAADQYFAFGPTGNAGWIPLTGDWSGPDVAAFVPSAAFAEASQKSLEMPAELSSADHNKAGESSIVDGEVQLGDESTTQPETLEFSDQEVAVNDPVIATLTKPIDEAESEPDKQSKKLMLLDQAILALV